jgi:hypothetical protein
VTNEELRIKLAELSGQCDGSREQMAVNGVLCALIASMFDNSQPALLRCIRSYTDSESNQQPNSEPLNAERDPVM